MSNAVEILGRHLRWSARQAAKAPVATAVVVVSLALGVGANAAIFSVVKAVLLTPLPYEDPGSLVLIRTAPPGQRDRHDDVSVPQYTWFRDKTSSFLTVGATDSFWAVNLGPKDNGSPAERIVGHRFSATLFRALGVQPELGRLYTPAEDTYGAMPTIVLSHNLWQRRFGGDPSILDRTIPLDGVAATVVGIMPPDFGFLDRGAEFWIPFRFTPALLEGRVHWITAVARLKPDISLAQAESDIQSVFTEFQRAYPDRDEGWTVHLQELSDAASAGLGRPLLVLQVAVVLLLLIACVNLAAIILARASSRQRDAALRVALGESRFSMISQLLTEGICLALCGGSLGLFLAGIAMRPLVSASPSWLPRTSTIAFDGSIVFFAALVSLTTGLLFGLLPALNLSKPNLATMLTDDARGTSAGRDRQRWRATLVVAQVALAVVLLIGSCLMLTSFLRLTRSIFGLNPTGLLTFQVRLPIAEHIKEIGVVDGFNVVDFDPSVAVFFDRVLERIRSIPDVASATAATFPPLSGSDPVGFQIEDYLPLAVLAEDLEALHYWVGPDYFSTLGTPVLRGREFTSADSSFSPWVVVVNEAFAQRFFSTEDPLGHRLRFDMLEEERSREIVGVVSNVARGVGDAEPRPMIYAPYSQQLLRHQGRFAERRMQMTYIIRANGDELRLGPTIREAVGEVDRHQPIFNVRTLDSYIDERIESPRYYMLVLSVFGLIAILTAIVGVYGLMSFSVVQQTREFGVRRALGATPGGVVWLVLRRAAVLGLTGVVLGLLLAFILSRYIDSILWGTDVRDPWIYGAVSMLVFVTVIVASFLPSIRAATNDPLESLRG
jgi:predicted permease